MKQQQNEQTLWFSVVIESVRVCLSDETVALYDGFFEVGLHGVQVVV